MTPEAYVYFAESQSGSSIKIGFSRNPERRIASLDCRPLLLWPMNFAEQARYYERMFHERFAEHRIEGEWYRPTEQILSLVSYAKAAGVGKSIG